MLVVLSSLPGAAEAAQTVQRALAAASRPVGLRFALPEAYREAFDREDVLFYSGEEPLEAVLPLLTDETYFLHLMGEHGFAPKWDARLYDALRHVSGPALVSASVSPPVGGVPAPVADDDADTRVYDRAALGTAPLPHPAVEAEAYLPALADRFEDNAVQIVRGLPLVCAAGPVRTLVADPALLFGTVDFLRRAEPALATLSIAAYVAGFSVYALQDAPLWPLAEPPRRWLRRPVPDALPGTTLSRFEQLAGFRYDRQRAGVRTTWGLFGAEDVYPQRLPRGLRLAQHARATRMRLSERYMPLLVTAFVDLPSPRRPVAAYILRFGFLKAVESLPLLLYTGGAQERLLRAGFPNTQSYQRCAAPRPDGHGHEPHGPFPAQQAPADAPRRQPTPGIYARRLGGHGHPAPSGVRRGGAVLQQADGRPHPPGHGGRGAGPQLCGGPGGPAQAPVQPHQGPDPAGRGAQAGMERGAALDPPDRGGAGPVCASPHAPAAAVVSDRL